MIPWLIASVFLLTSCNFPGQQPQPSADDLSTRVAQTLTAWPTFPSTMTPRPSPTLINPTATTASSTTPTLTATIPANDPVLTLGTPPYADTFTSGSAFGVKEPYEDAAIHIEATDGALLFRSLAMYQGKRWRLTYPFARNLYLEGTFTTLSCAGADTYGLMFRAPQYNDGVGFFVSLSCKGQIKFERFDGSKSFVLLDWTFAPTANAPKGQTNRLGVMAQDQQFSIYVNGVLVKSLTDNTLTQKGHYGVFVSADETPNFTFKVDEIKEWDLP
jgi:hypothetical protein